MYKLVNDSRFNILACIVRTNEDGSVTSFGQDPDNTDYQEYLKWLEAGNTPEPADQGEQA